MKQVQFIQYTPQQLKEEIGEEIKKQFDVFLKQYVPKSSEQYLTRKEVSDLLKINLSTVHLWSKKGVLNRHAIGSRIYYLRSDIEAKLIPLE